MEKLCNFHKLSPEVLGLIADHVVPEDLFNFRLVCKGFLAATNARFGERYFSEIRLRCTEDSLKAFVDAAKNP